MNTNRAPRRGEKEKKPFSSKHHGDSDGVEIFEREQTSSGFSLSSVGGTGPDSSEKSPAVCALVRFQLSCLHEPSVIKVHDSNI